MTMLDIGTITRIQRAFHLNMRIHSFPQLTSGRSNARVSVGVKGLRLSSPLPGEPDSSIEGS